LIQICIKANTNAKDPLSICQLQAYYAVTQQNTYHCFQIIE